MCLLYVSQSHKNMAQTQFKLSMSCRPQTPISEIFRFALVNNISQKHAVQAQYLSAHFKLRLESSWLPKLAWSSYLAPLQSALFSVQLAWPLPPRTPTCWCWTQGTWKAETRTGATARTTWWNLLRIPTGVHFLDSSRCAIQTLFLASFVNKNLLRSLSQK